MYRYCLFDLDGTLTDSSEGICKSVGYALESVGIHVEDITTLKCFIGPPLRTSFRTFYGLDDETMERAIGFYRERYSTVGKFENKPYPGVENLLKELKEAGVCLVVASSKPEVYVREIMAHFNLEQYFTHIVGGDLEGKREAKEEVIKEALRRLGIETPEEKKEIIMIGDRHFDINGAKFFGLDSLGVTYGFAPENELSEYGADYIADTMDEIKEIVLGKE